MLQGDWRLQTIRFVLEQTHHAALYRYDAIGRATGQRSRLAFSLGRPRARIAARISFAQCGRHLASPVAPCGQFQIPSRRACATRPPLKAIAPATSDQQSMWKMQRILRRVRDTVLLGSSHLAKVLNPRASGKAPTQRKFELLVRAGSAGRWSPSSRSVTNM